MNKFLTRIREWLIVPDDDRQQRVLLDLYESCRTRDEKAACALLIGDRLDEMAETASGARVGHLHEEAAQWRSLFKTEEN